MATKQELQRGLTVLMAISEAIREAKELPEGPLYAMVMGKINLAGFEAGLEMLRRGRLVERKNHVVRWIGPTIS